MKTSPILAEAEGFAKHIINEGDQTTTSSSSSQTVHHYHHDYPSYYYWGWGRPWSFYDSCYDYRPIYISNCSSSCRSDKRKDDSWLIVVIAASVVALASSFFIGKDLGNISQANRMMKSLKTEQEKSSDEPKIQKVINIEKKMLEDIKSSSESGLLLKGSLAASAVTVGVGSFLGTAPILVVAGLLSGGVSSAALIVRQGYLNADTTPKEDATRLLHAVNEAKA